MCKMEIEDAPQGDIYNQRRRNRNTYFRHRENDRQEFAERLANQMRLNDDAGNLRYANREIRSNLTVYREQRLYLGFWKNICSAIDTHAILGQGTEDQKRTLRKIIAEAFKQNNFDYIENGYPGEYASYSRLTDIYSERVVNESQIRFASSFIEHIDIPSLELEGGHYHYLELNIRANEYIRNRIDSLSRIIGLWVHICNTIHEQFRDFNGNLTNTREAQARRIRRIIASVFIGNGFRFAHPVNASASDYDETSILFRHNMTR